MTRRTYGVLAGLTGTLLSIMWWRSRSAELNERHHDRGVVIYRNTPVAPETESL